MMVDLLSQIHTKAAEHGVPFTLAWTTPQGTVTVTWSPPPQLDDPAAEQPRPPRTLIDQWRAEADGE